MATCSVCGGAMLTEQPHRHQTTDETVFWCDVCGKSDDAPHTPIDHPWLLRGYSHGKHCRDLKDRHAALVAAARFAVAELGVPDETYPAPVANAIAALRAALDGEK